MLHKLDVIYSRDMWDKEKNIAEQKKQAINIFTAMVELLKQIS